MSPTSCSVHSRYSPVSLSMTRMPSLKLVNATRPGSMRKSFLGSRPQSTYLLGDEAMASSTTCGGMRTMRVSGSTVQPPSLKMSRASSASTNTPVRSSTSSEARWMSSSSDSVNTLTLSPRLRVPPACRFRFTPLLLVWIAESGALLEARHAVDGHVEHLGDVELRLHGAGVRGVRELLHRDPAEAEVAAHVVHDDRVGEVGDGAAELLRHVGSWLA